MAFTSNTHSRPVFPGMPGRGVNFWEFLMVGWDF
jgi:hypothetical protein